MKPVFVETASVQAGRASVARLEDTRMGQPGIGVFWGRSGRGKTEFAREFAARTGAVYLRVLEDWSPRAMLASLCFELNGSEPSTVDRCKRTACEALEASRRLILVDEADRLSVGLVEHLRDIHDLSGIPIVLIGEEILFPTLNARRRLWSRVTETVEFGPIGPEDIMLFAMKAASIRIDADAARAVASRSGGDFRLIWHDVHAIEGMSRANRTDCVDASMVNAIPPRRAGSRILPRAAGRGGRNDRS